LSSYSWKSINLSRFLGKGVTTADRHRIIRATLYSFLIQGVSVLLVFASNLWMVRSSDPASYGLYVHLFNWVSILAILVLAGRDDLVLALIPRYAAGNQPLRIARLIKKCNRWLLLASLVVGGGFIAFIFVVPVRTLSEYRWLFLLSMAAVYFTACLGLNQPVLQALNHIRLSQVVEKIGKPLLLMVCIAVFRLAAIPFSGKTLVLLSSIVLGICSAVVLVVIGRKVKRFNAAGAVLPAQENAGIPAAESAAPPAANEAPPTKENLSRKTFYFFAISLLNLLSVRIAMLMLPYFLPAKDIGIFNIASRFADLLIFPFFLMHTVLPQLFARHSAAGSAYTQSLFNESNRLMCILCIPLLLINIIAGKWLLHWFGPDFGQGYAALVIISVAQFLFSFFGPSNTILMMQDGEKYSALCLLIYVVVLAVLCRMLIPVAGVTGSAIAILISSLLYNVLLAVVGYRVSRIHSPFFSFLIRQRH
jgi:O-antigen/teichoic acid export membrane protein